MLQTFIGVVYAVIKNIDVGSLSRMSINFATDAIEVTKEIHRRQGSIGDNVNNGTDFLITVWKISGGGPNQCIACSLIANGLLRHIGKVKTNITVREENVTVINFVRFDVYGASYIATIGC